MGLPKSPRQCNRPVTIAPQCPIPKNTEPLPKEIVEYRTTSHDTKRTRPWGYTHHEIVGIFLWGKKICL